MPSRRYRPSKRDGADFIEIDLLPNVRRPRVFNANVLLVVLLVVVLSFLLIYLPFASRQSVLNENLEEYNDFNYRLELVNQEISGYGIEAERLRYLGVIADIEDLNSDFFDQIEVINDTVTAKGGMIYKIDYDAVNLKYNVTVQLTNHNLFLELEWDFLELEFVHDLTHTNYFEIGGSPIAYRMIYTIEVNRHVE